MEPTTKPSNFLLKSSYAPTITDKGTILTLDLQSNISLKSKDKYVLIVLDVSGSMSGSKINTSKEAICEVIKTLFEHTAHPKVDLIAFNSSPRFYNLQGKSENECLKIVNGISAGGGTNFIPVFNMTQEVIKAATANKNAAPAPASTSLVSKAMNVVKNALKFAEDEIAPSKAEELAVILLSDGQGEPLATLKPHLAQLRALAEERLSSAEFHTLGFGAGHDARLLEEMTKIMPTQGTFQYLKESREIKTCIETVTGCLIEKRLSAFVSWKSKEKSLDKRVNFVPQHDKAKEPGMEACFEAFVCFDKPLSEFEELKNTLKLNIKLEEGYEVMEVVANYRKPEGRAAEMRSNCTFINEELKKISDAIISGEKFDAKKAEEYRNQVANLRIMLSELVKDIFKLKIDDRKMVIDATQDLNEYMDKIGELLRESAKSGLTNDQIASVNALAYRQVTKKSHLKTLDKRALQNVELLNQVASKVKEASSKLNEKEFSEKYQSLIDEVGCCSLNLSNVLDALKSEDCLCLTFDIGRPEVAIQDASRIIIKKIYPTVICATAFMDCIKYSMKLNPNNSGGFDVAYQGDIVKGASNESITAALPLFLCSEHWEVASQYIKPIIGWDVTLDPLGYDYNQIRTVPFLLLIKALNDKHENPNEFNTRVVKWLTETCCQTIKDEIASNPKNNLLQSVKPIWEKYDVDGTLRGVESVQNNNILLAHIYCLQQMELLKADTKELFMTKVKYMLEEDMRRRQEKAKIWTGSLLKKNIKKILCLDVDQYLDQLRKDQKTTSPVEEAKVEEKKEEKTTSGETTEAREKRLLDVYRKAKSAKKNQKTSKSDSIARREALNKARANKNKEEKEEKNTEFKLNAPKEFLERIAAAGLKADDIFPAEFEKVDKQQKEYLADALQSYKNASRFLKPWYKILGYDSEELNRVQNIGLRTPLQLFALHIQNKMHHKNSDRLESFQDNQYVDCFNEEAAKEFIFRLAGQVIYNVWQKELDSKPKELSCSKEDVQFFVETNNLEAAAGLLVGGFNLGSYEYFQQVVRREPEKSQKIYEKLLMLRHEEYEGVEFELPFHPRKKFARQLYKKFKNKYDYKQWQEVWYREHKK